MAVVGKLVGLVLEVVVDDDLVHIVVLVVGSKCY